MTSVPELVYLCSPLRSRLACFEFTPFLCASLVFHAVNLSLHHMLGPFYVRFSAYRMCNSKCVGSSSTVALCAAVRLMLLLRFRIFCVRSRHPPIRRLLVSVLVLRYPRCVQSILLVHFHSCRLLSTLVLSLCLSRCSFSCSFSYPSVHMLEFHSSSFWFTFCLKKHEQRIQAFVCNSCDSPCCSCCLFSCSLFWVSRLGPTSTRSGYGPFSSSSSLLSSTSSLHHSLARDPSNHCSY